jgi:hypothetical protein
MKYSEFNKKIAQLGFSLSYLENNVYVEYNHDIVAKVDLHVRYVLDTHFNRMRELEPVIAFQVFLACCELSETKIPDRQKEKRYRLRLSAPIVASDEYIYLTHIFTKDHYQLGSGSINDSTWKTIFTESEIAEMDITGFQKVEVTE